MGQNEEVQFGKMALEKGMITKEQLVTILSKFKKEGPQTSLEALLIQEQYLTPQQAQNLRIFLDQKNKVGPYRVLAKLGEGGMGKVYKVIHQTSGEIRALKILNGELSKDPLVVQRFIREAETCILLNHPNIVRSFEIQNYKTTYYIAMEFIEGASLDDYIAKMGQLSEEQGLSICRKVAQALKMAHAHGVIHRDIKPENILISTAGEIKLTDFGLAKVKTVTGNSLTQTGMFMGTPAYISPEQAKGEKTLDIRSDLYSLGITLFHMLTGRLPFDSESALVICQKHLLEPLPDPAEFNGTLTEGTTQLIQCLSQKDPEDRPQNPQELIERIDDILRGSSMNRTTSGPRARPRGLTKKRTTLRRLDSGRNILIPPGSSVSKTAAVISVLVALCALGLFLFSLSSKNSSKKNGSTKKQTDSFDPLFRQAVAKENFNRADQLMKEHFSEIGHYQKAYKKLKKTFQITIPHLLKTDQFFQAREKIRQLIWGKTSLVTGSSPMIKHLKKTWKGAITARLQAIQKDQRDFFRDVFLSGEVSSLQNTDQLETQNKAIIQFMSIFKKKEITGDPDCPKKLVEELNHLETLRLQLDSYRRVLAKDNPLEKSFPQALNIARKIMDIVWRDRAKPDFWEKTIYRSFEKWEKQKKWAFFERLWDDLSKQQDPWILEARIFSLPYGDEWISRSLKKRWFIYRDFCRKIKTAWKNLADQMEKKLSRGPILGKNIWDETKITQVDLIKQPPEIWFEHPKKGKKVHKITTLTLKQLFWIKIVLPEDFFYLFCLRAKANPKGYKKRFLHFYRRLDPRDQQNLDADDVPPPYRRTAGNLLAWAREKTAQLKKIEPPVPINKPLLKETPSESAKRLQKFYLFYQQGQYEKGLEALKQWTPQKNGSKDLKKGLEAFFLLAWMFTDNEFLFSRGEARVRAWNNFKKVETELLNLFPRTFRREHLALGLLNSIEESREKGIFVKAVNKSESFQEKFKNTLLYNRGKENLQNRLFLYKITCYYRHPARMDLRFPGALKRVIGLEDFWHQIEKLSLKTMGKKGRQLVRAIRFFTLLKHQKSLIQTCEKKDINLLRILNQQNLNQALFLILSISSEPNRVLRSQKGSFPPSARSTKGFWAYFIKFYKKIPYEIPRKYRLQKIIIFVLKNLLQKVYQNLTLIYKKLGKATYMVHSLPSGFDSLCTDFHSSVSIAYLLLSLPEEDQVVGSRQWVYLGFLVNVLREMRSQRPPGALRQLSFFKWRILKDRLEKTLLKFNDEVKEIRTRKPFTFPLPQTSKFFFFPRGDLFYGALGMQNGFRRNFWKRPVLVQRVPGQLYRLRLDAYWPKKGTLAISVEDGPTVEISREKKQWIWWLGRKRSGPTKTFFAPSNNLDFLVVNIVLNHRKKIWQIRRGSTQIVFQGRLTNPDPSPDQLFKIYNNQVKIKKIVQSLSGSKFALKKCFKNVLRSLGGEDQGDPPAKRPKKGRRGRHKKRKKH